MLVVARQTQDVLANTLAKSLWHNQQTWFSLNFRMFELSLQMNLYILISSKFLGYFQIDDGSVLPKMVQKRRSQGRKINGPGAVIHDVMIQRLWRFSSSQFCHFLQYV